MRDLMGDDEGEFSFGGGGENGAPTDDHLMGPERYRQRLCCINDIHQKGRGILAAAWVALGDPRGERIEVASQRRNGLPYRRQVAHYIAAIGEIIGVPREAVSGQVVVPEARRCAGVPGESIRKGLFISLL